MAHRIACALAILAALAAPACQGDRGGLGAPCAGEHDCASGLQCLGDMCTARCDNHVECGDGARCDDDGRCVAVEAAIGDGCVSEIDCGRGQSCALDFRDEDGDGRLGATCQASGAGAVLGDPCVADGDCRSGTCALGMCAQLCGAAGDCPPTTTCADLPRPLVPGAPLAGLCLPARGVIEQTVFPSLAEQRLEIAVPSHARSFAVVATVDDPNVVVGAAELSAPDGRPLYRAPSTPEQFFANPIRHLAAIGVGTLLVPNTPRVALTTGVYRARLAARFEPGQPAPTIPDVKIVFKVDDSATLDLHFVFLDLDEHPCRSAWGGGALDASTAPDAPAWRTHVAELGSIFGAAGLTIGAITYRDLERADLDALDRTRVGELFSLATEPTGITVFVVRGLGPVGVQGLAGHPAPPRTPGTPASGVVVGADTLCYRPWSSFTRLTAHQMAAAMGLFRNREPDGAEDHVDPIDDTGGDSDNLMFFGERGGVQLSDGQAAVLRRYPGLR